MLSWPSAPARSMQIGPQVGDVIAAAELAIHAIRDRGVVGGAVDAVRAGECDLVGAAEHPVRARRAGVQIAVAELAQSARLRRDRGRVRRGLAGDELADQARLRVDDHARERLRIGCERGARPNAARSGTADRSRSGTPGRDEPKVLWPGTPLLFVPATSRRPNDSSGLIGGWPASAIWICVRMIIEVEAGELDRHNMSPSAILANDSVRPGWGRERRAFSLRTSGVRAALVSTPV